MKRVDQAWTKRQNAPFLARPDAERLEAAGLKPPRDRTPSPRRDATATTIKHGGARSNTVERCERMDQAWTTRRCFIPSPALLSRYALVRR